MRAYRSICSYLASEISTADRDVETDKTTTKNPSEWSSRYRTPILCCVSEAEYEKAKKAFETLNRNGGMDSEIKSALAFLESTTLFGIIADEEKRNAAFKRDIVGEYSTLLADLDKVR